MGSSEPVNWREFIPVVHPAKVLIVEALRWIDRPLSASELEKVFGDQVGAATISYHLDTLASWDVLAQAGREGASDARQRLYASGPAAMCLGRAGSS